MVRTEIKTRHLIDSRDWNLEEIDRLWRFSRQLRDGGCPLGIDECLARKSIVLWFNKSSTRTRLTVHQAIVEMGGTPLLIGEEDVHSLRIENIRDLARAMAASCSAICIRLLPTEGVPYGQGEALLRQIAMTAKQSGRVPVISLSHDRCHPCQGLSEMMTVQDALEQNDLRGTRILFTWVRGREARPWSPTQDSLMLATRLGMNVTLCHPPEYGLDPEVVDHCRQNAAKSEGAFCCTEEFAEAFQSQQVVYARHWATEEQQSCDKHEDWYCDEASLGEAFFLNPMPLARGDEVSAGVADCEQSLLEPLVQSKFFLQKAVLATCAGGFCE